MGQNSLFQLLNPMVMMLFSIGFFIIYFQFKKLEAAAWWGTSYSFGALAFVLDIYRNNFDEIRISYLINTIFMLVPIFFVIAIAKRYNKTPPLAGSIALLILTEFGLTWFWFVDPDILGRTYVINIGIGLMFALGLPLFFGRLKYVMDRIIFLCLAAMILQCVVRTPLVNYFTSESMTPENYANTSHALALHFISAIISLSLAVSLFLAFGMEIILELENRLDIDVLTRVLNRRGFEAAARRSIDSARQSKRPLSLIMCDIDDFKRVNDTHGHAMGDQVIVAFADILKLSCRQTDCVGRLGGEEFCIILPTANLDTAFEIAEKSRGKLEAERISGLPTRESVTASFGISKLEIYDTYETLLARADAALYVAKRQGKNRVELGVERPRRSVERWRTVPATGTFG